MLEELKMMGCLESRERLGSAGIAGDETLPERFVTKHLWDDVKRQLGHAPCGSVCCRLGAARGMGGTGCATRWEGAGPRIASFRSEHGTARKLAGTEVTPGRLHLPEPRRRGQCEQDAQVFPQNQLQASHQSHQKRIITGTPLLIPAITGIRVTCTINRFAVLGIGRQCWIVC